MMLLSEDQLSLRAEQGNSIVTHVLCEKAHKMNLLHKNAALEDDLILLSDLSQPDVHHDVHTLLEKQPLRLITLPHHLERSTSPPCDTEELLDS